MACIWSWLAGRLLVMGRMAVRAAQARCPSGPRAPGNPAVAVMNCSLLTIRLWTSVGDGAAVRTVSREPRLVRLSSPSPEVNAAKDDPRALRSALVDEVLVDVLARTSSSKVRCQRASMALPMVLKKLCTWNSVVVPLSTFRRSTSSER